jgi:hypothetical protein
VPYDKTIPVVGVAFGYRHQRTAISITERHHVPTGEQFTRAYQSGMPMHERLQLRERLHTEYRVRHLERHGPDVICSRVNRRLVELVKELDQDLALILDVTGTGRPVWDLLRGHAKVVFKVVKMVRNGGIRV